MIINRDILRRDTLALLKDIDAQIDEVEEEAEKKGVPPEEFRDSTGSWVMIPLLQAKAQAYNTLVLLQN